MPVEVTHLSSDGGILLKWGDLKVLFDCPIRIPASLSLGEDPWVETLLPPTFDLSSIDAIVASSVPAMLGLPAALDPRRGFNGAVFAPAACVELAAAAMYRIAALPLAPIAHALEATHKPGPAPHTGSAGDAWHAERPYTAAAVARALARITSVSPTSPAIVRARGHAHAAAAALDLAWTAGPHALALTPQSSGLGAGAVFWLVGDAAATAGAGAGTFSHSDFSRTFFSILADIHHVFEVNTCFGSLY
mgnify:CR=1 FL=1